MSRELRLRFLASLAASGALVGVTLTACGGAVESTGTGTGGSSGSSGASSSGGSSGSSGYSSGGYSSSGQPLGPLPPPSTPTPVPPSNVCPYGKPTTTCYTHAQLVAQGGRHGQGGDSTADAGALDAGLVFDPNGCLPPGEVEDGCCNAAVAGPTWTGSTCCYVHCTGSCCGRPVLVDGEARVAAVLDRDDWLLGPAAPALGAPALSAVPASGTHLIASAYAYGAVDPRTRERIAAAWARDAAMEHASVASFARFTLDLLALGAPADLVLGAQDAGRDEIEHARACFAIASRHAGRALGPGKLEVGGAAPAVDLATAVAAAIVEGCIGETLSALLAEARLARAEDADVRAALRRIANEEARHAELAWRFVGWAIVAGGEDVRAAAARAFRGALARAPQTWDDGLRGIPADTLRSHGLLDERAAREVAERALHDVVAPCVVALVGDVATAA
jgi:hypothetical protein